MRVRSSDLFGTFKDTFSNFRLSHPSMLSATAPTDLLAKGDVTESATAVTEQHSLQRLLRPAFGKGESGPVTIGNHPDFDDLADTELTRVAPIVTFFMDIESSTRLGLWYDASEVAQIKNAFICTAIELVHAFDGHVHRIQGDAVMAFFGGTGMKPENAVIDALNASSALWLFVKSTVVPKLKEEGYDEDFGIRIGIDFAPEAHWQSFGFPGVNEVSATAFQVDAASKLQHSAGRNQIMLGQSLVEHIDLPDAVTQVKTVKRDGKQQTEIYLSPNHLLRNGTRHNYRQVLLRAEEYLRCSPLADAAAEHIGDPRFQRLKIGMTIHEEKFGSVIDEYSATSLVLPKDHWIRFELSLPFQPRLPYTITFEVQNHGNESREGGGEDHGNHSMTKKVATPRQHKNIVHWERTAYRGLHYMTITVCDISQVVARRRVGIFVE